MPELPSMDPLLSLMKDPVVPERKRFCNSCQAKLNHERGFCPMCGNEYSFTPTLKAGDVVANQFEIKGAIAYGGLGWIYLSWDSTLSRWVVLKGLLNSKDEASAAVALAERQFLASVKHSKIVGIYNFVSEGTEGYIVMEYVGGKTLKAIRQERGPLPVPEAVAYIHGILPAFAYLQRQGLVYCDFKPDNVMLEDGDVKLIDLGGVRRADDTQGDIYGTKGYSAPEGGETPSHSSDLYTLARTLAVLIMDFKFQGQYEFTLPTPTEHPIFERYESLYYFLLKATHKEADRRFQSAEEMSEQLMGVLREIVSLDSTPHPSESRFFMGDAMAERNEMSEKQWEEFYRLLPAAKSDSLDPAANLLMAMGSMSESGRRNALERAIKQYPDSIETPLKLAELYTETGQLSLVEAALKVAENLDPFDWLPIWYRGKYLMAQKKWKQAQQLFYLVYGEIPGETAPKLAIALNSEMAGEWTTAIKYYDLVSRVDPSYVSAIFGLARCQMQLGDRGSTVSAYQRISATSTLFPQSQMAMVRALIRQKPNPPGVQELKSVDIAMKSLKPEGLTYHLLASDVFIAGIDGIVSKVIVADPKTLLLGKKLELNDLRAGAEAQLRQCAKFATTLSAKLEFVDRANAIRPITLF